LTFDPVNPKSMVLMIYHHTILMLAKEKVSKNFFIMQTFPYIPSGVTLTL
jgi:hypothetical protein